MGLKGPCRLCQPVGQFDVRDGTHQRPIVGIHPAQGLIHDDLEAEHLGLDCMFGDCPGQVGLVVHAKGTRERQGEVVCTPTPIVQGRS